MSLDLDGLDIVFVSSYRVKFIKGCNRFRLLILGCRYLSVEYEEIDRIKLVEWELGNSQFNN